MKEDQTLLPEADAACVEQAETYKDAAIALLDSIPGINRRAAEGTLAEIGTGMPRFQQRKCRATTRLPRLGIQQSWVTSTARRGCSCRCPYEEHLSLRFVSPHQGEARRKASHDGGGTSILVICYHLLNYHVAYQEVGGNYFDEHERQAVQKRLVRRLEKLGYEVSLQPATHLA